MPIARLVSAAVFALVMIGCAGDDEETAGNGTSAQTAGANEEKPADAPANTAPSGSKGKTFNMPLAACWGASAGKSYPTMESFTKVEDGSLGNSSVCGLGSLSFSVSGNEVTFDGFADPHVVGSAMSRGDVLMLANDVHLPGRDGLWFCTVSCVQVEKDGPYGFGTNCIAKSMTSEESGHGTPDNNCMEMFVAKK